jgi:hypothetical protein
LKLSPIERLLPRVFWGEKVPKADEGGFATFVIFGQCRAVVGVLLVYGSFQTPPHPAFGHLLPHKKWGEGARLERGAIKSVKNKGALFAMCDCDRTIVVKN